MITNIIFSMATPMKRVAMILTNPCTHDSRVIKEAESLAANGYEITVFCLHRNDLPTEEFRDGVRYVRIPLAADYWRYMKYPLYAVSLAVTLPCVALNRLLRLFPKPMPVYSAARSLTAFRQYLRAIIVAAFRYRVTYHTFIATVLAYRPDIIHAHDLMTLPTGTIAAKKLGAKLVFDSHELEEHRDMPLPKWQKHQIRHLLNRYIPKADAMIVVSEGIEQYTKKHHRLHPPLHVIFNAPSHYKGKAPAHSLREQLAIPEASKLVIYIGGVGLNRGVELIVRAIALDTSLHLAILGPRHPHFDGLLEEVIRKTGTQAQVHFPPIVHNDDVIHTAADADAGIFIPHNTCLSHYYCMPNKLFEMLFARLPIVGSSNSYDIARFIHQYGIGETVNQHDPQDVLAGLRLAIASKEQLRQDEEKYALLKSLFSWEAQEQKLLSLYSALYAPPSGA